MSLVVFYLLCCVCRLSMPGLTSHTKMTIFFLRIGYLAVGSLAAYGFYWLCLTEHIVRDPYSAQNYMFALIGLGASTGEIVSRRKLRSTIAFPKDKPIPFTY